MVHREEQHVSPDPDPLRARRYGCRDHERRRQIPVVYEVMLGEPDPRKAEPLTLLDLLQALGVEPGVVPERQLLPEVVPEPEGRSGTVCGQSASLASASGPSLHSARGALPAGGASLAPAAEATSGPPSVIERLAGVDDVGVGYAVGRRQILDSGPPLEGELGERSEE